MKKFKQILAEAKKSIQINRDAENIHEPYRTPEDIRKIMSGSSGDDTMEWNTTHTAHDQGVARGAKSVTTEEDITPERLREIKRSEEILRSIAGNISTTPSEKTSNVYSDEEIAKIMKIPRTTVGYVARQALEKLKRILSVSDLG